MGTITPARPSGSLTDVKEVQDKILATFEEFKTRNHERLKGVQKRGVEDPVARKQMQKITKDLTALKSQRDDLDKLAKRMSRPGGDGGDG